MTSLECEFALKDRVLIREIQRPAIVMAVIFDNLGVQYRVRYWDNGSREEVWLFADELEPRKMRD